MLDYGTVKSVEIGNDKDADSVKYICQVEFSDSDDIRPVQVINFTGVNSRPMVGDKVVVVDIGGGFEVGICSDDGIDSDLDDGDTEIYSISGTSKSASIRLLSDGVIVINAGNDFLVRYNALESAFNELQDKHNILLSELKTHTHLGVTAGSGSTASAVLTSTDSVGDITLSKIEEINAP